MKDFKIYSIETGNPIQMDIPEDTVFYTEKEVSVNRIVLPPGRWNEVNKELTEAQKKREIKREQILEQESESDNKEMDKE